MSSVQLANALQNCNLAWLMHQPPRARHERLLSWGLAVRAYLWLGLLEAAIALAAFFFVLCERNASQVWLFSQGGSSDRPEIVCCFLVIAI